MARGKAVTMKGKNARSTGAKLRVKPPPETYRHPEATSLLRPDVGTQAQFRKKKPPVTYRYDSSLSPALKWDGQNPAREKGEELIGRVLDAGKVTLPEEPEAQVKVLQEELKKAHAAAREFTRHVGTISELGGKS